jgi:DNA replication protein DnaC
MKNFEIVEEKAKELIPDFKHIELYDILAEYFSGSSLFENRGYDLDKGILITGGVGTGKTQAFKIFRELLRSSNGFFKMESTRKIIRDYSEHGVKVLNQYGMDSKHPIYFDDLGLEEVNVRMYGNTANVMNEILLDRYDNFRSEGVKTYASSNLGAKQFEEIYGERTRDRIREMCNIINVTGKSFRK